MLSPYQLVDRTPNTQSKLPDSNTISPRIFYPDNDSHFDYLAEFHDIYSLFRTLEMYMHTRKLTCSLERYPQLLNVDNRLFVLIVED